MKINKLDLSKLHNEEIFQFFTDFKRLAEQSGADTLHIEELFAVFVALFDRIDTALDVIRKNIHSQAVADKDMLRDSVYRGLTLLVEAFSHSLNADKAQASRNIQLVIDAFGDFRTKPFNEETATIKNFIDDLWARCSNDLELLGGTEWVGDLENTNREFSELMDTRFDEQAEQEYINLRTTRREAEDNYMEIAERVNAAIVFNGPEAYSGFVNKLNERIDYNRNVIAQRIGRAKAEKERKKAEEAAKNN